MRDTLPRQGQDLHHYDTSRFAAPAALRSEFGGAGRGAGMSSGASHSSEGNPGIPRPRNVSAPPRQCLHTDDDLPDESPSSETVLLFGTIALLAAGMAFVWYAAVMAGGI